MTKRFPERSRPLTVCRRIVGIFFSVIALTAVVTGAHAVEPWVMVGQTLIQPGSMVLDPAPNRVPLQGAVYVNPYCVPPDKVLVITGYGIEGNLEGLNIFVWLGDVPPGAKSVSSYEPWWEHISSNALYSIAGQGSKAEFGFNFRVPEGICVHAAIMSLARYPLIHGWFVQGYLEDGR
jgi:hypothetical protein